VGFLLEDFDSKFLGEVSV